MTNLSASEEIEYWPCIQGYVPDMSLATVWPELDVNAIAEIGSYDNNDSEELRRLRQAVVDLSLPQEDLNVLINHYILASSSPLIKKSDFNKSLYLHFFEHVQKNRHKAIKGIIRYAKRQEKMSQSIEERRATIERYQNNIVDENFSQDMKSDLEQLKIDQTWETRLFLEREKKLNYLCELPVKLEQRIFFIGRFLNQ
jgi:hypothetical protein